MRKIRSWRCCSETDWAATTWKGGENLNGSSEEAGSEEGGAKEGGAESGKEDGKRMLASISGERGLHEERG